jgi:hypothetical protein
MQLLETTPMPVWSIKIIPGAPGHPAQFVADVPTIPAGNPLLVFSGDLVSWNNTTGAVHQPWPTDSNHVPLPAATVGAHGAPNYLSDPIPIHQSSTPSWSATSSPVTNKTIFYCCKLHPQERGKIVIT